MAFYDFILLTFRWSIHPRRPTLSKYFFKALSSAVSRILLPKTTWREICMTIWKRGDYRWQPGTHEYLVINTYYYRSSLHQWAKSHPSLMSTFKDSITHLQSLVRSFLYVWSYCECLDKYINTRFIANLMVDPCVSISHNPQSTHTWQSLKIKHFLQKDLLNQTFHLFLTKKTFWNYFQWEKISNILFS